jgi:glycosyltransferase involved in cell wall biosynthesis
LNVLFKKEPSLERQDAIMRLIPDRKGIIHLNPQWRKDYTTIIKSNLKVVDPSYVLNQHKGLKEFYDKINETAQIFKEKGAYGIKDLPSSIPPEDTWTKVKPTWSNAMKFLDAVKSRGVIATALDVTGIDKNSGERVSEEVYQQRRLSCFGNASQNIASCERLKEIPERGFFCGGCGCGNNDLARLDSDTPNGYSKLHYPELECPLKRKGFSNYEVSYIKTPHDVSLSIIIPVLNDNDELNATIESIRSTSPSNVEIIVIDDQSDFPAYVNDKNVKLVRTETRLGVGGTRHLGASMATAPYLLFIDSHMRFDENWYNNAIKRLASTDHSIVWCGVCLGLEEGHMDINFHKGAYHGARLALYEEKENQVFEGKWIPEQDGMEYEISCLMGACYFFHKSWFFHIGGTKSLKMWGSDEPLLSVKTYLAGGAIKLMKDVRIGHKFRNVASYSTPDAYIIYNKLRSMKMLFSEDIYEILKSKISNSGNKEEALRMIEADQEEVEIERNYYKKIFVRDDKWLIQKFKLAV